MCGSGKPAHAVKLDYRSNFYYTAHCSGYMKETGAMPTRFLRGHVCSKEPD
jgi:hypothetical protein